ncbi:hypothetical protein AK812_SmicGene33563 [Symbiodinium microadriaticum]|uniref:Uncharacterized protein n=1 Tax=Symbiodinium microadriaticum TaxID=2951 RepID=A0A1Q9CR80_SYMMI|nr:hypothetical protein AK812_SmicGene33563 [Symbiodinium microadriaticum]
MCACTAALPRLCPRSAFYTDSGRLKAWGQSGCRVSTLRVQSAKTDLQAGIRYGAALVALFTARCGRQAAGRPCRTALKAQPACASVLVLGFDGVICADAEEVAAAACQAAFELWPDVMRNAEDVTLNEAGVRQSWVDYDWQRLLEHKASAVFTDAPPWLLYKVQKLRPACQAGWEMLLFARLCVEEAVACRANRAKGRGGARPLTIGEIECNWLAHPGEFGLRELLLMRWGNLSIAQLQDAMADARRRHRSEGLLVEIKFYSEVLRVVWLAVAAGRIGETVHIITSRDQISATHALQMASAGAADLPFEPPDFQGSWAGKEGLIIVDDSVIFLKACASKLNLAAARLYLASWGYVSHRHWADGRSGLPRVKELSGAEDLAAVLPEPRPAYPATAQAQPFATFAMRGAFRRHVRRGCWKLVGF